MCGSMLSILLLTLVELSALALLSGKPHPETFLRAAELIGVEPQARVQAAECPWVA